MGRASWEDPPRRVEGLKYLQSLCPLLERLQAAGCERDRAGNRELFFPQYVSLILLTFFNPALKSLRALQQASELDQVQRKLRCKRVSLGSLSEAGRVFDAELLEPIIAELAERIPATPGEAARRVCRPCLPQSMARCSRPCPKSPRRAMPHAAIRAGSCIRTSNCSAAFPRG